MFTNKISKPIFLSLKILSERAINSLPSLRNEILEFNNLLPESANVSGDYKSYDLIAESMEFRLKNLDTQSNNLERKKI